MMRKIIKWTLLGAMVFAFLAVVMFQDFRFHSVESECFLGLKDYEGCLGDKEESVRSERGGGMIFNYELNLFPDESEGGFLIFSSFFVWLVGFFKAVTAPAFLKAISAPSVVVITYLLLRKKLSLYLLRDVIESKVKEMLRAQEKVKKCIPEHFESIEEKLSSVPSPVALAGGKDFEFLLECFGEVSDLSVEAPGNVATYSRLSELVFVQVQEVERMRCQKQSERYSGNSPSGGKTRRISQDLLYRRALSFCNLIEYSSLRTVPVPQVETKKFSLLPDVKNKKLSGDSSEFIGGLSQGAFVRYDHIYCAEFFYQALTPVIRGDYCFHKAFFMLVGNNGVLSLGLRRKGFFVPLELNLSDISRTERERKDPDIVDFAGDSKLFLIGWNEVDHFDDQGSSQQVQLYYTCLQGNKFFLGKYPGNDINDFFVDKAGVTPVSIQSYPDDMVVKLQVKRKDISFGFLKKSFNRYVRPLRSL